MRRHRQHLRHHRRTSLRQRRRQQARKTRISLNIQPPHPRNIRIRRRPRPLRPPLSTPPPPLLPSLHPRSQHSLRRIPALRLTNPLVHIRLHNRIVHARDPQQLPQPSVLDLRVAERLPLHLSVAARRVGGDYAVLEVGEVFVAAGARAALVVLWGRMSIYVISLNLGMRSKSMNECILVSSPSSSARSPWSTYPCPCPCPCPPPRDPLR